MNCADKLLSDFDFHQSLTNFGIVLLYFKDCIQKEFGKIEWLDISLHWIGDDLRPGMEIAIASMKPLMVGMTNGEIQLCLEIDNNICVLNKCLFDPKSLDDILSATIDHIYTMID